jgi:hypothetical protein
MSDFYYDPAPSPAKIVLMTEEDAPEYTLRAIDTMDQPHSTSFQSSRAGPGHGFVRESEVAVVEAIAQELVEDAAEVPRVDETRLQLIALNHTGPAPLDKRFARMKPARAHVVRDHSAS